MEEPNWPLKSKDVSKLQDLVAEEMSIIREAGEYTPEDEEQLIRLDGLYRRLSALEMYVTVKELYKNV